MSFNPSKCNILRTRALPTRNTIQRLYTLHGQVLHEVNHAKYLGVLISNDLSWTPHIDYISKKANQKLGFLKRNLRGSPISSKKLAYTSLIRSGLEYAASVWDTSLKKDITKLERVQRRSARWVKSQYSTYDTSVDAMLSDLGWATLADRRKNLRLILLYQIYHTERNLIAIDHSEVDLVKNTRPHRTAKHLKQIHRPKVGLKSTIPKTINEWNSLSDALVCADPDSFKGQLATAVNP